MHTPNRKWKKTRPSRRAPFIFFSCCCHQHYQLWETTHLQATRSSLTQQTSSPMMLTNRAAQQSSSRTEERQRSSKRNSLMVTGHLCVDQLHPRHNLQILEQLSHHAVNWWRLPMLLLGFTEVSWTKECCRRGPEVSPAGTIKLKIKTIISYAVELQEMLLPYGPHCNCPGIIIINKRIHLPCLLR